MLTRFVPFVRRPSGSPRAYRLAKWRSLKEWQRRPAREDTRKMRCHIQAGLLQVSWENFFT